MIHRLLIVTGHDRPGIVSAVSGLLSKHKINLEDVRMSILEGQFAMMFVAKFPSTEIEATLERALLTLQKTWQLQIFLCPMGSLISAKIQLAKGTGRQSASAYVIRVLGKDKTGIVAGVSQVLARYKINITDLQCRILGSGKKILYTMVLECQAPRSVRAAGLKSALKRLEQKLGIEIRLQNADILSL